MKPRFVKTLALDGEKEYGIDAQLGKCLSDGRQLSGCEWQRVTLTRALFRDTSIITLDEPTASLDSQVEEAIFQQMNAKEKRATKILISHRFQRREC